MWMRMLPNLHTSMTDTLTGNSPGQCGYKGAPPTCGGGPVRSAVEVPCSSPRTGTACAKGRHRPGLARRVVDKAMSRECNFVLCDTYLRK